MSQFSIKPLTFNLKDQTFDGKSLGRWIKTIKNIIIKTNSKSILDYGCGKGKLMEFLNEKGYKCTGYDPAIEKYDKSNFASIRFYFWYIN